MVELYNKIVDVFFKVIYLDFENLDAVQWAILIVFIVLLLVLLYFLGRWLKTRYSPQASPTLPGPGYTEYGSMDY